MSTKSSVLEAHDRLLAEMPPGASHAGCPICTDRETAASNIPDGQEETRVGDKRTFTEEEHEAILAEAVRREVAAATEAQDAQATELQNKVDALEAEKAALETQLAEAQQALEDEKGKADREREVAARRDGRIAAIRDISAHDLPDSYFTEDRVTRWAEMSDEQFGDFLDDYSAATVAAFTEEEAAALDGLEGDARRSKIVETVKARKDSDEARVPPRVETAAFAGGQAPGAGSARSEGSTLRTFLGAGRRAPVTN